MTEEKTDMTGWKICMDKDGKYEITNTGKKCTYNVRAGKCFGKAMTELCLAAAALFMVSPVLFLVTGSLMGDGEAKAYLGPVLFDAEGFATWRLLPRYPTLRNVVGLLLDSPEFFTMFWNTMKLSAATIVGQLVFAVPGAWGLARYEFPGRKLIYKLYVILMLLPFQVVMLPEYLVLDRLGLLDTLAAIVLPAVFSTFSVFLMYRFFTEIPEEIICAARVDGAGELQIFVWIGLPLGASGIFSALFLQFLECCSMIEQPVAFLKEKTAWPLALYLPEIEASQTGLAFTASLAALLVPLLLFWMGKDYLEAGIATAALKE